MLLKIKFNPAVLFVEILASITFYNNLISEIDIDVIYAQAGYSSDDHFYNGSPLDLDFSQCNIFCSAARMDLFAPTSGMMIRELFETFDTKKAWTHCYESLVTKQVVGLDQYPPIKVTKDAEVKMGFQKVPEHHALVIEIAETELKEITFQTMLKTEKTKCLCMSPKAYPKKKEDLDRLKALKLRMLADLDNSKTLTEYFKGQVSREMYKLQSIGNVTHLKTLLNKSLDVDVQSKISKIIQDQLNQIPLPLSTVLKNVKSPTDMAHLEALNAQFHSLVQLLGPMISKPLQSPISFMPWDRRDVFDPTILENLSPQMAVSENADDLKYLIVQIFEKNEKRLLNLNYRGQANFSTIDTTRDQFWSLSLWDFILAGFWIIQSLIIVIPYVASLISDIKYQHQIRKLRNRGRRDSISGKPFEIRKLMTFKTKKKGPYGNRPMAGTKSQQQRLQRNRSRSRDLEKLDSPIQVKQLRTSHKARAPPVPVSTVRARKKPKTVSDTTTIVTVVKNDDVPLYLADSLLSIP